MANDTQTIEMKLVISYSTEEGEAIDLSSISHALNELVFNALEHQRQEGTMSPAGLCCNYFELDVVKINEASEQ